MKAKNTQKKDGAKNNAVPSRLLSYAAGYKPLIILSAFLSVLYVGFSLLGPVLIGEAVDQAIAAGNVNFSALNKIVLGLLCVFLLGGASQRLLGLTTNKICFGMVSDIRRDAFKALTDSPVNFADKNAHGVVISKIINDTDIVSDGLLQGIMQLFTGVLMVVSTLVIMFVINYVIALIVLFLTPVSILVSAVITKNSYKMYRKQAELQGELYGHVSEMIDGQKTVKAYGQEKNSVNKFAEINARLNKTGWKTQYFSAMTNPSTRFINGLVTAAVGVAGCIFCINSGGAGMFTVGMLSVFLSYANQYTKPFNEVSAVLTQLSSAVSSAARVFGITDVPPEQTEGAAVDKSDGVFEIEDVAFSYDKSQKLLQSLNLSVRSGEKIAIVGATGSGKTTIINLLMRFYDIDFGKIFLDGKDIYGLELDGYRRRFGMVLQDTFLIKDTVRENIAYGNPNVSLEQVKQAAVAAGADVFIGGLKDGYDTVIDESVSLSHGERQLICIARILLTRPDILILDEATSSLDIVSEKYIQTAFKKIMEGRTSFIVAHRLSTIKDSDNILVMNEGSIAEQGTHAQLIEKRGVYYSLYNSQFETSDSAKTP